MAGKDLYIGRMLEHLQASMNAQQIAMENVSNQIMTVAKNTGQLVDHLNVKPGTDFSKMSPAQSGKGQSLQGIPSNMTNLTLIPGGVSLTAQANGQVNVVLAPIVLVSGNEVSSVYVTIANIITINDVVVAKGEEQSVILGKKSYSLRGVTTVLTVKPGDVIKYGAALRVPANFSKNVNLKTEFSNNQMDISYSLAVLTETGAFY